MLSLVGYKSSGVYLTDVGIGIVGDESLEFTFDELVIPPRVSKLLGFHAISMSVAGELFVVAGLGRREAEQFVHAASMAISRHSERKGYAKKLAAAVASLKAGRSSLLKDMAAVLGSEASRILDERFSIGYMAIERQLNALAMELEGLKHQSQFPSASLVQPYWLRVGRLVDSLPKPHRPNSLTPSRREKFNLVAKFLNDPEQLRQSGINTFISAGLPYFDNGPASRLTEEQRRAVLTDDDATLVLAGAGSGKTSVIVEKTAYLIERGIRRPHEILLVTFGNAAAKEIAERVRERVDADVEVRTFHALGYAIINEVEDPVPTPAPHASDEKKFTALLRSILLNDVAADPGLA